MEKKIEMPKLAPDMKDGVLVSWIKELDDQVKAGDVLFEVESDKVVCEIEATGDGRLDQVFFEEGERVKVGETVAVIKSEPAEQ